MKEEMNKQKLNYVALDKTPKCREFYFHNDGVYGFWKDYLIARLGAKNILLVNRTDKSFDDSEVKLTDIVEGNVRQELKERFCAARQCDDANPYCPIVSEWYTCLQLL